MSKYASCNESLANTEEGRKLIELRKGSAMSQSDFVYRWGQARNVMHDAGQCEGPADTDPADTIPSPDPELHHFFQDNL